MIIPGTQRLESTDHFQLTKSLSEKSSVLDLITTKRQDKIGFKITGTRQKQPPDIEAKTQLPLPTAKMPTFPIVSW